MLYLTAPEDCAMLRSSKHELRTYATPIAEAQVNIKQIYYL